MEGKVIDGIKKELRKEPEDWSCKFSYSDECLYSRSNIVPCEGKHRDRKHCPLWRRQS
jgi:hypothetical protein